MPDEPKDRIGPEDLDRLLGFLVQHDASDITIQTGEKIYAEIYGVLYQTTKRRMSKNEVAFLLNAIYGPNGTTQLASGEDLDTYYEFRPSRVERYRFRVNATACLVEGYTGIQITMRSIPTTPPELSEMGLPENIVENIAPLEGAVYVTGATGSGKSTLLASIIRSFAEDPDCNRKILTYEAPIEFVYDSIEKTSCLVSQSEIPKHLPSFEAGIRNALRRKPRLILVGECRDRETIDALLEASLTGHPVYTTVHSNGVAETVRRLVNSFPEEERNSKILDLVETMRLVIWQRLVPTVDKKRTPLREYLVFDPAIRNKLAVMSPDEVSIETRRLVKERGQTMYHDALAKHKAGIIGDDVLAQVERYSKGQDADLKQ
ncbi:MAG: Dot/Icm secretion system ATPase DotB [Legionellales bacterium]|nr:Dot/Icm secretion system ATPase DotB [Legionellales bacterium]|tara:strand:+ start:528 stop:1652 length:1125 start_codon:yes stop_codon:yes gene_type:complete